MLLEGLTYLSDKLGYLGDLGGYLSVFECITQESFGCR
jgi:hypothetical protein